MSNQDLELMKKILAIMLNNAQAVTKLEIDVKDVRGLYMKLLLKKDK